MRALPTTLTSIVLTMSSCTTTPAIPDETIVVGVPLSVSQTYGEYEGALATVLNVNGKMVLAYNDRNYNSGSFEGRNLNELYYAKAAAVIQAEISDGDSEPINLVGRYVGSEFEIKSITANDITVNLYF